MQLSNVRQSLLILAGVILGIMVGVNIRPDRAAEPLPHSSLTGKSVVGAGLSNEASSPGTGTTVNSLVLPLVANTSQKIERWNLISREGWITLVDRDTGAMNPALASLMELSPPMQSAITAKIERMMELNTKLECQRAYVCVSANGDEEIIVPPAKGDEVLKLFSASLGELGLEKETADFLTERALRDPNLGLLNTPIKLGIQIDGNSSTKLTTYGKVVGSTTLAEIMEAKAPDFAGRSPIVEITMQGALDAAAEKRFSHLWKMAATLPRKPAPIPTGSSVLHPGLE